MAKCERCGANLVSNIERRGGVCDLCEFGIHADSPVVPRMELSTIVPEQRVCPPEAVRVAKACVGVAMAGILVALGYVVVIFLTISASPAPVAMAILNLLVAIPVNVKLIGLGNGLLTLQESVRATFARRIWTLYAVTVSVWALLVGEYLHFCATTNLPSRDLLKILMLALYPTLAVAMAVVIGNLTKQLALPGVEAAFTGVTLEEDSIVEG